MKLFYKMSYYLQMRIFYFFDIQIQSWCFELMLWRISRWLEQKQALLWLIIIAVLIIISWCNNLDYNTDTLIWRKIKQYVTPEVKWSPWMPQSTKWNFGKLKLSFSTGNKAHIFICLKCCGLENKHTLVHSSRWCCPDVQSHLWTPFEHLLMITTKSKICIKIPPWQTKRPWKIWGLHFPIFFFHVLCLVALKRS